MADLDDRDFTMPLDLDAPVEITLETSTPMPRRMARGTTVPPPTPRLRRASMPTPIPQAIPTLIAHAPTEAAPRPIANVDTAAFETWLAQGNDLETAFGRETSPFEHPESVPVQRITLVKPWWKYAALGAAAFGVVLAAIIVAATQGNDAAASAVPAPRARIEQPPLIVEPPLAPPPVIAAPVAAPAPAVAPVKASPTKTKTRRHGKRHRR